MKRSIRRHQQQVAKIRKLKIVYGHAHGYSFKAFPHEYWVSSYTRPWRSYRKLTMHEPGYWVREMMTRPARIRCNQLLQLVKIGHRDADGVNWPDNRKPHLYYW